MHQDPTDFDEADYLAANPDVAAAVQAGVFSSGSDHYSRYGRQEKRITRIIRRSPPLSLPFPPGSDPSRRDRILANLDLQSMDGVEIGPLANPLVSPWEGRIFYVDWADTDTLRARYAHDPAVDVSKIMPVHAVWGQNSLQDCIGRERRVDYVVASHVIEHVPDLITWLAEIRSILKPTGTLRLAVPDRRYTFDYLRFESRIHDVLDAYLKRARAPLPRQIMEFHHLIRDVDQVAAWNGPLDPEALPRRASSIRTGFEAAQDAIRTGAYYDTHCWVFTPLSFAELFGEIAELDLLGFSCETYFETQRNRLEFFVHLSPCDDKDRILASWAGMKAALRQPSPAPQPATRKSWLRWFRESPR